MRSITIAMLSAIALFRACSSAQPAPVEQSTADRFRDSIGVNLHLQYAASAYRDERKVAKALDYLGITHVRDSGLRRGDEALDSFAELGRHGIRFDLFFNAELAPQLSRVRHLEQAAPGTVDLLEGPNEINNDPVTFGGRSSVEGGQAYQAALYAWSKADPVFGGLQVLNYTDWPPTGGRADAVNTHTYAKAGRDPQAQMFKDVELAAAALPSGLPLYITETGSPTSVVPRPPPWVSPAQQADLTLISLLEAFRLGVCRTYLYELFDESSLGQDSPEAHYGLFDQATMAKPAAREIHSLLTQLKAMETNKPIVGPIRAVVKGAHSLLLTTTSGDDL